MAGIARQCGRSVFALLCVGALATPAFSQTFTFADNPLTAQVTAIKALHITEVRTAINTLRSHAGLVPFVFTDPVLTEGTTPINALHITELRTALNAVYVALASTPPTYTDSPLVAGSTAIKAVHISELRSAVLAVNTSGPTITSLGATSAVPVRLLTINGTGFDAAARMSAIFTDSANRTIEVIALDVTASRLDVPVPPFVNVSGQLASGVVSVQVKKVATSTKTSNIVSGFQILAVPTTPLPPGTLLKGFLNAARSQALSLMTEPVASAVFTELNGSVEDAGQLIGKIQPVLDAPMTTFSLGTIDGQPLTVGAAELADADRMLLAMLQGLGAPSAPALAVDTPGCNEAEGDAASDAASNPDEALFSDAIGDVLFAPRRTVPCSFAPAFNTSFKLVIGLGGLAVVSFALLGAAPISLALSGAALLYLAIGVGGGQIALGGALNQTSAAAGQLVQQGVKTLEDKLQDLLVGLTPAGEFAEIKNGVKDLYEAVTTSPLPPPEPPPPPPVVTGIAFLTTGLFTSAGVTPVIEDVSVHYSLVGTDGYYLSGTLLTDANGVIGFAVAGACGGVVDTVIVTVAAGPSASTTHTWGNACGASLTSRVGPPR